MQKYMNEYIGQIVGGLIAESCVLREKNAALEAEIAKLTARLAEVEGK